MSTTYAALVFVLLASMQPLSAQVRLMTRRGTAQLTRDLSADWQRLPKPAELTAEQRGPSGDPALPEKGSNPAPSAVTDEPPGVSNRRRKLRLNQRS
jgi:hypothetical protein